MGLRADAKLPLCVPLQRTMMLRLFMSGTSPATAAARTATTGARRATGRAAALKAGWTATLLLRAAAMVPTTRLRAKLAGALVYLCSCCAWSDVLRREVTAAALALI